MTSLSADRGPRPAASSLVFDCFSGIAGDMTIAALVDAGASLDVIRAGLARLELPPFEIVASPVVRGGLRALHVDVHVERERTYQPEEMRAIIRGAAFPARVEGRALAAIDWLARGESLAHDNPDPHLHEAGGVDAMVDLVGAMLALEDLDVEEASCPVVTVGSGTIARSEHGPIPAAPGPAAAHILQAGGFPLRFVEASHELVTPTGAAILAAVARPRAATLTLTAHGAGAGTFDPPGRPNALRVFLGRRQPAADLSPAREVVQLQANIDDMPPTLVAHARDRLMEEGALDAWTEAIGMKKGRAATKLCALVQADDESRFAALFLSETTTLGVRATSFRRYEAARHFETATTSLGAVRVKVSESQGRTHRAPEYEDVKRIAVTLGLPALEVQRRIERELSGA